MPARKRGSKYKAASIIVALSVALAMSIAANIFYASLGYESSPLSAIEKISGNISDVSDLSINGFVKVENVSVQPLIDRDNVVLAKGCVGLVGAVDKIQGTSITNGLNKEVSIRPNTHDLMKDAFDVLGIKVIMVKVVDIRSSNFIGRLIVQQDDKILSLDSRPSDGVALALRTDAPIYVNKTLMDSNGQNIC